MRLSEEERDMLKEYRDENYPSAPLGLVVKLLIEQSDA